jgi:predicted transcriptional regulator
MANNYKLPTILVSKEIDLYGLNPYDFRIYAHIAHRGKCYSKLETIGTICKISTRKTQSSLKNLCDLGLVKQIKRTWTTDIYTIESMNNWKKLENITEIQTEEINVEEVQPIFLHGVLDLYGLNPYDFRIYAHIAAYKGSYESNFEQIKSICKMSIRKAQYSVKNLCDLGLIKKVKYKGKKILYVMTSRNEWKDPVYSQKLENERNKFEKSLLSPNQNNDAVL